MKNILITFTNAIDPTTGGVEGYIIILCLILGSMDIMCLLRIKEKLIMIKIPSIPKRYLWSILLIMLDILIS